MTMMVPVRPMPALNQTNKNIQLLTIKNIKTSENQVIIYLQWTIGGPGYWKVF